MKTSIVLAVECAFSVEILRSIADRGVERFVIREDVVFLSIAARDERATRKRSTRNRLDAGNRKSRAIVELLLGKLGDETAGFLRLVRQLESSVIALGIGDVITHDTNRNTVAVSEALGDRLAVLAVLELEVKMRTGRIGSGISDLPDDEALAHAIAIFHGDGIVLHVRVARADVVAVIDDNVVAPRIARSSILDDAFGGCQHRLALVIVAGQAEVPAVLTIGASRMAPRTDIRLRPVVLAVALVVAELAVARPRLGHFPLVLGVERNLEVGRDVAQRERLDAVDRVVTRFVADAVGVGHLLVVEVVDGFRDLARRSEREDHGHDDENDRTHDVSFLLLLQFLPPWNIPRKSFQINQIKLNQDVKEHLVNSSSQNIHRNEIDSAKCGESEEIRASTSQI